MKKVGSGIRILILISFTDRRMRISYQGCVERLYCKRPIQCLASSRILTPPPPQPASVYPPPLVGGKDHWDRYETFLRRTHSLGGEGGGGSIFWKTPDTALYSIYSLHSTYVSTLCMGGTLQDKQPRHPGCACRIAKSPLHTRFSIFMKHNSPLKYSYELFCW